jgi:hypothetical protein
MPWLGARLSEKTAESPAEEWEKEFAVPFPRQPFCRWPSFAAITAPVMPDLSRRRLG